jgi:hypothetical protein
MATAATGAGFVLEEKSTSLNSSGTLHFPLIQSGRLSSDHSDLNTADLRPARSESLKRFIESPYVGMSLGFAAICGAVASLALAFTGSL